MYCNKCGAQLPEQATFCPQCGTAFAPVPPAAPQQPYGAPQQPYGAPQQPYGAPQQPYGAPQYGYGYAAPPKPSGLATAAKILMIVSTVIFGLYLIPLAWCLPMTISYSKKLKTGQPVSTGFKICTLLFVNTVAGILMLCDNQNK